MSTPASPLPTAAQWPEISRLLDEVLGLPAAEREAWLARLAAANAVHHDALRGLMDTLGKIEGDDFLSELPRLDVDHSPGASEPQAGQIVGPYRLLREIGVGGMGTVWLAERADGLVRRRVALKLPRAVWGGRFAERLSRESRILAALEHEHIARLYDAGLDDRGRPFLALEYIEGQPIDAYCRERGLALREREELLLQTMAAVSHAHARLVVHRDLKPANILVTHDGQVKLLDFGIAKLMETDRTEATALTRMAGRALTLDYASPEQIRGEPLGTASDVYSLGVIAYELLAEAKPYRLRRGSAAEMEEAIASADVRLASDAVASPALRKALRGDLDAILNRALKKSVDERYPGVDAFAQDLQHHLRGEPVQARPDRPGYRAAKFIRRHALPVALASTLVLAMGVGGGLAVWQAVVAQRQERRAEDEARRQEAVRDLYDETMMALSVTASEHPEAFTKPHVISRALRDKLQELEPRFRGRPSERAAQLDAVMLQLNYDNEFEASLSVGLAYLAHLKAHGGTPFQVLNAYAVLGRNLFQLKRFDECEAMRREGVAWAPDATDPPTVLTRLSLASDLGNILRQRGKRAEALSVLSRAEAASRRIPPDSPQIFEVQHVLANFHTGFDEAAQLRAAAAAHEGMAANVTLDPDQRATDLLFWGTALLANGRAAEAETTFREAQAINFEAYGRTSRNGIAATGRLASAISRRGDFERAAAFLSDESRASSIGKDGLPPDAMRRLLERQLENAWLWGNASLVDTLPRLDLPSLATKATVRENLLLLENDALALSLTARRGDASAVMQALRKAWPDPGLATSGWSRILECQMLVQLAAGDAASARRTAAELTALFDAANAPHGRAAVNALEVAALASARLGETQAAASALARADAVRPAPPFPSEVEHAESLLRRAEVLRALGRGTDSIATARDALALLKSQHPDSPRLEQARRLSDA